MKMMYSMKLIVSLALAIVMFPVTVSGQKFERLDSPNVTELLERLPFEAPYPIAREIRYIYSSVLELKKKEFDPFIVTNERPQYFELTKTGVIGEQTLQSQYSAFQAQGRTWINRNQDNWSASELQGYTSFQNSMESSMATMHSYYAVMGAMSGLAYSWTRNEAESLSTWARAVTKCSGESAPKGSVLHLNMMRLTKGERFKFHSANDFVLTATLERPDSTFVICTQVMQAWVNTKKEKVSPEEAVPFFESTAQEDKLELLKPTATNNFTHRFALLLNAAIEDIYAKLADQ
jgi:hypothetical protein